MEPCRLASKRWEFPPLRQRFIPVGPPSVDSGLRSRALGEHVTTPGFTGEPYSPKPRGRNRTPDPLLTREPLYRLSYRGNVDKYTSIPQRMQVSFPILGIAIPKEGIVKMCKRRGVTTSLSSQAPHDKAGRLPRWNSCSIRRQKHNVANRLPHHLSVRTDTDTSAKVHPPQLPP